MQGKKQLSAGIGPLLAAGANLFGSGEGNRGLSPIIFQVLNAELSPLQRKVNELLGVSERAFQPPL